MSSALEPDAMRMREMGDAVLARIVEHLATLDTQRLSPRDPREATDYAKRLREPLPAQGTDLDALLDVIFDEALPRSMTLPAGGCLGFVPIGGLYEGALADLIAASTNRYMGSSFAAPVLAQMEATSIDWLREVVGLPSGGGILTSGGSLAQLSALVAARRARLGDEFQHGVIYASDQTHHSIPKAASIAGFRESQYRLIATGPDLRMDVPALRDAIAQDRARGLEPFFLVGNAGTTNAGSVDDLRALAQVAREERLWLHVDAAYGGMFALTRRGAEAFAGIEDADSVTLDPHKGMFLPIGTGALLVRDVDTLRRAHTMRSDYIPAPEGEIVNFADLGPELTRPFRGLRIWLAVKLHGIDAFRALLDEKLDLAAWAADELSRVPGVTIVAPPSLSTFAFAARDDAQTEKVMRAVNAEGTVFLSGTKLHGRSVVRVCVLNHRTHEKELRACIDAVRRAVDPS